MAFLASVPRLDYWWILGGQEEKFAVAVGEGRGMPPELAWVPITLLRGRYRELKVHLPSVIPCVKYDEYIASPV